MNGQVLFVLLVLATMLTVIYTNCPNANFTARRKDEIIQQKNTGIGTAGALGIALMVLHITGYLTGWAWPLLYVLFNFSWYGYGE